MKHGYDCKKSDLKDLERFDEIFIRKLLDAPSKTPVVALYLELGLVPLRFVKKARRIMYLHYILSCKEEEMIKKVLRA